MKIYIDSEFKCYVENDGTMREVETEEFEGKCTEYIEGYRFVPFGETWVREDGERFEGEMIAPWEPHDKLDAAQREYERQQISDMQSIIAELDLALLDSTYNNIVGDIIS